MSLADARVLSAFAQGLARPYMLGVEQRLTDAGTSLERLTGGAAGWARLNHAVVTTANTFSTTSSSAVDVTGLSLDFRSYGGRLLLLAWAQDFYCDTTSGATAEVGFSVDGGAERWVWQHTVAGTAENDTFGLAAITAVSAASGRHVIKVRARTNAGTLNIRAGSDWPMLLMAVEL